MSKYLVAIHFPDNIDPKFFEDPAMHRDIGALNEEMVAAGVRFFAGGLKPVALAKSLKAKSVRAKSAEDLIITDGPYLETKEHIGGFWILDCASFEDALEWGRKAVVACRANVEVRPFHEMPPG
jgi:hypothetical protein